MTKINVSHDKCLPVSDGSACAPLGTPVEVRGKLALLGWPSLSVWAEHHGYARNMAVYVVKQWAGKEKRPHGGIARHLMKDLRETLATEKRYENTVVEH